MKKVLLSGCLIVSLLFSGNLVFAESVNIDSTSVTIELGEEQYNSSSSLSNEDAIETMAMVEGDFLYSSYKGGVEINCYFGYGGNVEVPKTINGLNVVSIGREAFSMTDYSGSISKISLPDTITEIGALAFEDCTGLSSINIPQGVTFLGEFAFNECKSLREVSLPNSVISIGKACFKESGLTSIVIPESVTEMGEDVFQDCYSLISADIKTPISSLPAGLFGHCNNLTSVSFSEGLERMEGSPLDVGLFCGCGLKKVELPDSLEFIGDSSFQSCESLESVSLGSNVKEIDDAAFANCPSLSDIIIPNSVRTIGRSAFAGTSISEIHLGNVEVINSHVFTNTKLDHFVVGNSVKLVRDYGLSMESIWGGYDDTLKYVRFKNPNTVITLSPYTIQEGVIIIGDEGSLAQAYALKYNRSFVVNGSASDTYEDENFPVTCSYRTQIQNIGWQGYAYDGELSGTSGRSLRLEGIEIAVSGANNLGVKYKTHVENYGWQDYVTNGVMSGTSGKGLRLEAIEIVLTDDDADNYDIYYRTHVQNIGWMNWAKNGEDSGSSGYGYRLEGIEIVIVEAGKAPPSVDFASGESFISAD
ncbi:leucine-rich repeat protein [Acetobacterium carbinolicum]|uniref:leucine-rich repeat protein n=1 Tax=Acetobacterium carbinolicum TaxID=52690 RepID=UPI0039C9E4C3